MSFVSVFVGLVSGLLVKLAMSVSPPSEHMVARDIGWSS